MPSTTESQSTPLLAARAQNIEPFYAVAIFREAMELAAKGRAMILSVGEPDFPTPPSVVAAAHAALLRGETHYTVALGIPQLRRAIAEQYRACYGTEVDERRVIVTSGASGALLLAFGALADPGSEFLMADPGYPSNRAILSFCSARAVLIPVSAAERFQLTADLVRQHWTAQTRGVMIASPANPTGTTIPHDELEKIAAVVRERGGTLVVDEIYHGLTYGHRPPTAASLGSDVFVVNSFSKFYCMTGWRLGWLLAPEPYVEAIERMAQHLFIAPPTPSQWAGVAALEPENVSIFRAQCEEFRIRRDYLVPALNGLGLTVACEPDGAFYAYADCSRFATDSWRFTRELLHQAGVAITPGRDFGQHRASDFVRFSFTCSIPELQEAVRRIGEFLNTGSATGWAVAP
ncbi:MAG: aminotransferase class I/II-fold pyridoxal phosphate-dependent enzyme [Gemmatimonadaceae bacterium]